MCQTNIWVSPDERIKKIISENGPFGPKPTEHSICEVRFFEINLSSNANSEYLGDSSEKELKIIIGEANTALDREIDKLLLTMKKSESSLVSIKIESIDVSFKVNLTDFESRGLIYQWTTEEKCNMALHHKKTGVELFRNGRFIDASHRFSKGLKLLLSIPVPVDDIPEKIDSILLSDLNNYKANLYNNLASCYSKENINETVIELCSKVLEIDANNCKALCKRGFAYTGNRDYERAKCDLEKVLEQEGDNKAVMEKLHFVNLNLNKQEADYASIVKKMFSK